VAVVVLAAQTGVLVMARAVVLVVALVVMAGLILQAAVEQFVLSGPEMPVVSHQRAQAHLNF
jgi:hypothetical protein